MSGDGKERLGFPGLIHGFYNPMDVVVRNFRLRWKDPQDIPKSCSGDPAMIPDFDLTQADVAVVLSVCLTTWEETVKFAWDWFKLGQAGQPLPPHPLELPSCVLKRPDGDCIHPVQLRYRRIHMRASIGTALSAESTEADPGLDVLFLLAQHPGWWMAHAPPATRYWIPGLRGVSRSPDGEEIPTALQLSLRTFELAMVPIAGNNRQAAYIPAYHE